MKRGRRRRMKSTTTKESTKRNQMHRRVKKHQSTQKRRQRLWWTPSDDPAASHHDDDDDDDDADLSLWLRIDMKSNERKEVNFEACLEWTTITQKDRQTFFSWLFHSKSHTKKEQEGISSNSTLTIFGEKRGRRKRQSFDSYRRLFHVFLSSQTKRERKYRRVTWKREKILTVMIPPSLLLLLIDFLSGLDNCKDEIVWEILVDRTLKWLRRYRRRRKHKRDH